MVRVHSPSLVWKFPTPVGRTLQDESVLAIVVIAVYSYLNAKTKMQVEPLGPYVTYPNFEAEGFSTAVTNDLLYQSGTDAHAPLMRSYSHGNYVPIWSEHNVAVYLITHGYKKGVWVLQREKP